jgi:hypothetical protein
MTGELAGLTDPISVLGFLFVTTLGTPARCASFGAGEALKEPRLQAGKTRYPHYSIADHLV